MGKDSLYLKQVESSERTTLDSFSLSAMPHTKRAYTGVHGRQFDFLNPRDDGLAQLSILKDEYGYHCIERETRFVHCRIFCFLSLLNLRFRKTQAVTENTGRVLSVNIKHPQDWDKRMIGLEKALENLHHETGGLFSDGPNRRRKYGTYTSGFTHGNGRQVSNG
jgi:hypothetical protein